MRDPARFVSVTDTWCMSQFACRFFWPTSLVEATGTNAMPDRTYNALFVGTGNAARSQMAEALLNFMAKGRIHAFSAGSHPEAKVQPLAAELIAGLGFPKETLRTKSWDEFAVAGAPEMDLVITLCDTAAGEVCPAWPGHPAVAHWGIPDPARTPDDRDAFKEAWLELHLRVELLLALPLEKLDRIAREQQLLLIANR